MNYNKQPLIFVVDDDEDDLYFIRSAIQSNIPNSRVHCYIHGKQLLAELSKPNAAMPVMIIMDLNMPVLNGKDTLKQIRKDKTLGYIPVVILSTSDHPREKASCLKAGANDYFCKPTSLNVYDHIIQGLKTEYIDKIGALN